MPQGRRRRGKQRLKSNSATSEHNVILDSLEVFIGFAQVLLDYENGEVLSKCIFACVESAVATCITKVLLIFECSETRQQAWFDGSVMICYVCKKTCVSIV